jgi:hypothetical protein
MLHSERDREFHRLFHHLWSSQGIEKASLGPRYDKESWLELETLLFHEAVDQETVARRTELIDRLESVSKELDGPFFEAASWEKLRREAADYRPSR